MVNSIILAGDSKKVTVEEGVANKSLVYIQGKPMVAYVVDALREAKKVGKISVVGPVDELKPLLGDKVDFYFPDTESLFDNIRIGIVPFRSDHRILIITSDIPMIRGEMIDDFIRESENCGADFCYPIVGKERNEEIFPGSKRTYVHLKEGTFTGGNAIYMDPQVIDRCEEFSRKLIDFRKKPWKTGKLLGLKFLVMFFLGALSIPKIEDRFAEILGIRATAIICDHPEIGNDVDKPEDIEMVRSYLSDIGVVGKHV